MMYSAPARFGAARSYRNVDLTSRVEGATPHALVGILFEELLKSLDAMIVAMRRGDFTQRASRQGRSLSILHGLEASLDHERGADIARDLALIYREARRRIMDGSRNNDMAQVEKAREMLNEIATAWERIS